MYNSTTLQIFFRYKIQKASNVDANPYSQTPVSIFQPKVPVTKQQVSCWTFWHLDNSLSSPWLLRLRVCTFCKSFNDSLLLVQLCLTCILDSTFNTCVGFYTRSYTLCYVATQVSKAVDFMLPSKRTCSCYIKLQQFCLSYIEF